MWWERQVLDTHAPHERQRSNTYVCFFYFLPLPTVTFGVEAETPNKKEESTISNGGNLSLIIVSAS